MIKSQLEWSSRVDYDGTLDGYAQAVGILVREALSAGAPSKPSRIYQSDGPNYNEERNRYAQLHVWWEVGVEGEEVRGE